MQDTFGQQLKDWRQRRRLSQMELGLTANVSARHISFLETGRARPSQPMVLQLSESLAVPRENRNALLSAAGFAASYQSRALDERDMRFVREAIRWTLQRHDPYPGIALDRHWIIKDANRCASGLLGPMGLSAGDSLLDALIDNGLFTEALENHAEISGHLAVRLRSESAFFGGDDILDAAAERLEARHGGKPSDPGGPFPAVIPAVYRVNGVSLSLFSTISQFGSAEDIALADMKLELMFPADDKTKSILLAAHGSPDGGLSD